MTSTMISEVLISGVQAFAPILGFPHSCLLELLGGAQMGSTLMGPLDAKVTMFAGLLGGKGTPWHRWEDTSRSTGVPESPNNYSVQKPDIRSDPISADPICPFPSSFLLSSALASASVCSLGSTWRFLL